MATMTATSQMSSTLEQPASKSKSSRSSKQSTKDPKRCNWLENSANPLLSGIEFRNADSDELVHFITIKHKEIQEDSPSFRITVPVEDDGTFIMPRKQTFEEIIQAKRRQQNALFASSHHNSSTSSVLSSRAARRVSAAARRQASTVNTSTSSRSSSRRLIQDEPLATPAPAQGVTASASRSRPRPKKKKSSRPSRARPRPKSKVIKPEPTQDDLSESQEQVLPSTSAAPEPTPRVTISTPIPTTSAVSSPTSKQLISKPFEVKPPGDDSDEWMAANNKPVQMISSMKELARSNPSLGTLDKKDLKKLLKGAPPGATVILSNGTVIKKSRRGGARVGAGRKRSRPLPNGSQPPASVSSANQQDSRSSMTNMSTSSDQTTVSNTANASETSNVATGNS